MTSLASEIGINVPIPVPKAVTSRWPETAHDEAHHRSHMHFPTAV